MKQLENFRNIEYDYKTPDDTFIGRGLHVNMITDYINNILGDVSADNVEAGTAQNIIVGSTLTDGAIFIKYYATNGTLADGGEITIVQQGGVIRGWSRPHTGDNIGLVFSTSIVGNNIILTLTADIGGGTIYFTYQKNIIEK